MNSKEIKLGEDYLFVGTDSPTRQHLTGLVFTVHEIKFVWRRKNKKSRQVKRFFNEFGEGARAEELEPIDDDLAMSIKATAIEYEANQRPASDYRDDPGTPF